MKNKKIALIIVIVIICISSVISWLIISYDNSQNRVDYYYAINSLIKDCNFSTANIGGEQIVLFDSEGNQINSVDFKNSSDSQNPIYIRKEGNNLFFVESVVVDDEIGVLFVNDNADEFLDGIWSIERVGGNSYKYSTAK